MSVKSLVSIFSFLCLLKSHLVFTRPYMRQFMSDNGEMQILVDDMLLDRRQYQYHFGEEVFFNRRSSTISRLIANQKTQDKAEERSGIIGKRYKWPHGIIPYEIDEYEYSDDQIQVIKGGIETLNDHLFGCIKIRPAKPSDKHRVKVQSKNGCFSSVGRQTSRSSQVLSLKSVGCVHPGTVMHEFIHAIGFFHEQSRPDRDDYIEIVKSNIKKGAESNFRKVSNTLTYGVPYDYKSIMHYRFNAFAKDRKKPTIVSKNPHITETRELSSRYPTEKDILKIRRMYHCSEGEYGAHGGYYDGSDHFDLTDDDYHEYIMEGEKGTYGTGSRNPAGHSGTYYDENYYYDHDYHH